ncbi:HK97-gp10 family putative phage morphogenesis protein [Geomicrobium sp. JCM 19039]|uniref:HK97-gp10 family putative phage morphogenesis protein n=1 Tax=Geomicrobium sp. JCM 19039 TaxID=1460636 RepID=UPI00045F43F2|nr:HK97-gp10 family putative phage morphogenesis protein [Geomicrobium sp. JCM 19039]GAK12242.1 hypothetical protein JCM19039_1997 [Geomicrobium sp. JCM 19039]
MAKDMFSMEIKGLDEAIRKLDRLEQSVDGAMDAALSAAALEVENEAKNRVPVKSHTLQRSITHKVQNGDALVGPFSEVPYAARIEFGFIGTDSLGRQYNQSAQPYLRPALESSRSRVLAVFNSSINDIIRSSS